MLTHKDSWILPQKFSTHLNDNRPVHGSEDEGSALTLALDLTRRSAEAISRRGGLYANSPLAAQLEALRNVAEDQRWLCSFEFLNRSPDARGFEHEVWFPDGPGSDVVFKATYDNSFGVRVDGGVALPLEYLERMQLQNEIFGDAVKLEGIWEVRPSVLRVVTSQPAIKGRAASDAEIVCFFEANGFRRFQLNGQSLWINDESQAVCADTHGGNILVDEHGDFAAIDVPVMLWPPSLKLP